jgi:hypothetical protein
MAKSTSNDHQNTTQKTKDRATHTPLKKLDDEISMVIFLLRLNVLIEHM